ncbi:MAG: trypsin-like serine protease [Labilithrix sp.]|nr:trypsin-like serine protease [Labilithrix sp.]MCW5809398.1 trypsin-like serine protease [Labilithrix sp.]
MKAPLLVATCAAIALAAIGCAAEGEREQSEDVATSTDAVVGGAAETGHAYVVGVGSAARASCSGTVIGKRTVLTAGHCYGFNGSGTKAIYIGNKTSGADVVKIAVVEAIRHPGYAVVDRKLTNDIAILKLASDAPMQPAPLFRGTMDNSPRFVGPKLTWVGFGDDVSSTSAFGTTGFGTKRIARFPIDVVGAAQVGGTPGTIDDTMFWYHVPGLSMCHGDSGGPAFLVENGVEHLIGVTSFGDPGCRSDGVQARADAPQIAAFIQPHLDAFEADDACRSDGVCNESCNAEGQVVDPDCHEAHAAADGVCSEAAEDDPDCAAR